MKRKHSKTTKKNRKVHSKKRSLITRARKPSRKRDRVRRKKAVAPTKPITDPRVARALWLMREQGFSASQSARAVGIKLNTLRRNAGRVLYQSGPGKPWKAHRDDQLALLVTIVTDMGARSVVATNYRERRVASAHDSAVRMWRAGEDGAEAALKAFEGETVGGYKLLTDTKRLAELEEAGLLDFDTFYTSLGARP